MSRRSVRARSSQIFSGLTISNRKVSLQDDSTGHNLPPPSYWKELLQSYHERIDKSYWISLGRGDLYADAMFQLQTKLEKLTRSLMYVVESVYDGFGVFWEDHRKSIRLFPRGVDDEEELPIFLHYDPKLLSRWKALFYVMAGNNYWGSFEVKSIELPKILMDEFTAAMDKKKTTLFPEDDYEYSLSFENNNLGSGMLNFGLLKELTITNNNIGQQPTISTSNCLRKLDLSGSDTGDESICLSTLLSSCTNLQELLLNNMPSGVTITNDCLGSNPRLQLLELKSNHLGDDNGKVLAASLGTNTNLETLSLHGNYFSKVSEDAFTKAICNDEDLNAVIDSNHTCTVCGVTEEIEGLQCTKEEKLFLSIKPNGASFIDVPLELMPMVLAWLQSVPNNENSDEASDEASDEDHWVFRTAVCLMFDALRTYWDLPSLFVGRHQPEEVKMCLRDMISTISNDKEIMCGQSFHQALLPVRNHGEYDTVLPITNEGLLLNLKEGSYDVGEGTYSFVFGFRRFPNDRKGPAEIFSKIKEKKDVITALNGISIIGKSFEEIVTLLKKEMKLSFLYVRLQSWKSFLQPVLDSIQLEYDICYDKSVSIQLELANLRNEYKVLAESQKQEVEHESSNIERLQRLHTRAQNDLKNRLQQIEKRFAVAEYNRGKAWSQLVGLRPGGCRCGHTCCCVRNYCQKAKKRRLD